MKAILLLAFAGLLFSTNAFGQMLYGPAPELGAVQWLFEEAQPPKDIHILYGWTTWCAPCRQSSKELAELIKSFPDRLSITAISPEDESVLKTYLTTEYRDQHPFDFARRDKKEFKSSMYTSKVTSFPFVIVIHENILVWEGGPSYPVGEFSSTISRLMSGRFHLETEIKEKSEQRKAIQAAQEGQKKVENLLKELGHEAEGLVSLIQKSVEKKPEDYTLYRDRHKILGLWAYTRLLFAKEKEVEGLEKKFKTLLQSSFQESFDAFIDSRDDLSFLASDIFGLSDTRMKNDPLAEKVMARASSLPPGGIFPEYVSLLESTALASQKKWGEAHEKIQDAIVLAKKQQVPQDFLDRFLGASREYKEKMPKECSNFSTCLKRAFGFLF